MSGRERRKRPSQDLQRRAKAASPAARSDPVLLLEQALYAALFLSVALAFDRELHVQFALPKLAWLRILVPCIAGLWLLRLHRDEIKPLPAWVFGSAIALTLWWVVSTCFALHVPTALYGSYGRYNGLWTHLTCMALFLFAASSKMSPEAVERLVKLFVAALVPVAIVGVYLYVHTDPAFPEHRSPSTLGHPVIAAATLGLAVPFIVTFLFFATGTLRRWLWGMVLLVTLAATVVTLSRGPWLGITGALAIVLLGRLRESRGRFSIPAVAVSLLALTVLASVALYVGARLRPGAYGSITGRFTFFGTALRIVLDYPLTGVGFESFALVYPRYGLKGNPAIGLDVIPSMVHNGYLQLAVTNGIPALALYLVFLVAILLTMRAAYRVLTEQRTRLVTVAFAASIAGYLIQDLSGWLEVSLSSFFWIVLGLAVSWGTAVRPAGTGLPRWGRVLGYAWGVIAIGGSLVLFTRTIREMRADALLTRAEVIATRDWRSVEADIAAALNDVPQDAAYLDRAGTLYARRVNGSADRDAYARGSAVLERAHQLNPIDLYVLIHRIDLETAALLQHVISTTSPGIDEAATAALQMGSNSPNVYEVCARLRVAQKQFAEGLRLVETAIALRQDQAQYYMLKGDILRFRGDGDGATAAYRKGITRIRAGTNEWASAKYVLITHLAALGKYAAALNESKDVIARAPHSSVSRTLEGMISRNMFPQGQ